MIFKSWIIEEDFKKLNKGITLFYGENLGLQNDIKKKLFIFHNKNEVFKYYQDRILKDKNNFLNQINNISLFNQKKIFFVNNVDDKIIELIKTISNDNDNYIYLFSGILEKKSKLRNYFEKDNKLNIVPCYEDNLVSIKNKILSSLKGYAGVSTEIINIIIDACGTDRVKLNNEINKIQNYFLKKKINLGELFKLLNFNENENFNIVKDAALLGKTTETNRLLSNSFIDAEKNIYYLTLISQRLAKLKEIQISKEKNIEKVLSSLKPPIFWKDKPYFSQQIKLWNLDKINLANNLIYDTEIKIKSNSLLNKNILLKKLILDICLVANVA